ncbi:MAG: hypothetical protein ABR545_04770 [Cyclonatronaceae bacterium]
MLRYFRIIRKKLIEQDNVRKYLLYAVGEILLVVIGILIALQVNTWNQNRLDSAAAANAQIRMLDDLYNELVAMDAVLSYGNTVRNYASRAISVFESGEFPEGLSSDSFLINLYQASQIQEVSQANSTYQELLASGKIELIKDDALRSSIISYYTYDWSNSIVFRVQDPYRENIRKEIPSPIQSLIRDECGDRYTRMRNTPIIVLPEVCDLSFDRELSDKTASDILKNNSLRSDLRYRIGNLDAQRLRVSNFRGDLEKIIANLEEQI